MTYQSILITGGKTEDRYQRANKIISEKKITAFDVMEVTGKQSIGINKIRELTRFMNLSPGKSAFKGAIIHSGEMMTVEAQNSLLKLLEEPPKHALIIITSISPEMLLPTVISRCHTITLLPKDGRRQINKLDDEIISSILAKSTSAGKIFQIAASYDQRGKALDLIESLTEILHFELVRRHQPNPKKQPDEADYPKFLSQISNKMLITLFNQLTIAKEALKANVNPRLTIEILFLLLNFGNFAKVANPKSEILNSK